MAANKITVNPGGLADDVHAVLEEYLEGLEEKSAVALAEVAVETVQQLQSSSPRDNGDYAAGWYIKQTVKARKANEVVIGNRHYQLTHLLEHGHIKVVHKTVLGFTAGKEHIRPAEQHAIKSMLDRIERAAKQ